MAENNEVAAARETSGHRAAAKRLLAVLALGTIGCAAVVAMVAWLALLGWGGYRIVVWLVALVHRT